MTERVDPKNTTVCGLSYNLAEKSWGVARDIFNAEVENEDVVLTRNANSILQKSRRLLSII